MRCAEKKNEFGVNCWW